MEIGERAGIIEAFDHGQDGAEQVDDLTDHVLEGLDLVLDLAVADLGPILEQPA